MLCTVLWFVYKFLWFSRAAIPYLERCILNALTIFEWWSLVGEVIMCVCVCVCVCE